MLKSRLFGVTGLAAVMTTAICLWTTAFAAENAPQRSAGEVTVAEGGSIEARTSQTAKPKFRGRLPRYYGKLVDDTQRKKIYSIQEKYFERDWQLREELKRLQADRDAEIEAVLTAGQKQVLQKMIAEARSPRATDDASE